ncbi:MAG: sigma E protease regulator RseP [Gammaproteobacteria bacterium]|nr:sigma E protease regulator RseP [Gammaproteobacteria bacterium]MDH3446745.1 sigma E protease regulator RseP [Gammaproteobacteria bacterium]
MDFLGIIYSILAFVVAIGILVTVHEFGHFWVARKLGVKVLRFSVGFGKPIWIRRSGEDQTEYVIASIPFGGYVKMLDEREGEVAAHELERSFNRKSVWRRIAIVSAGPAFNFLFAILAYYLIFLVGVGGIKPLVGEVSVPSPAYTAGVQQQDLILSVNGIETRSWEKARFTMLEEAVGKDRIVLQVQGRDLQIRDKVIDIRGLDLLQQEQIDLMRDLGLSSWRPDIPPVIAEVLPDGAAEQAGLQAEDRVVALDGIAVENARQWVRLIRENPGNTMKLEVLRNGDALALQLTPRSRTEAGETYGYIGVRNRVDIPESIRREMTVVERYGPVEGMLESLDKTWRMTWLTLRVLGKLVIGEASVRNLSGPITIAHYAGISARIGLEPFLGFLAIISISLGVLNLLPVPMLDGGHLLYYLVEVIKGSPVSEQTEIIGQKIGILLLFCLMSIAIYNDLLRLVE